MSKRWGDSFAGIILGASFWILPMMVGAQFVSFAGLPPEIIVPIFLPEYQYGDFAVINYGPRDSLASEVKAFLNGAYVASGENVTLLKGGTNVVNFTYKKTSDGSTATSTQTFVVAGAPTSSSGGGGGGTLDALAVSTTTTATTTATTTPISSATTTALSASSTVDVLSPELVGATTSLVTVALEKSGVILPRALQLGERGEEVRKLQEFLAGDPEIYPEGFMTGYFGELTRSAVRRFQIKYGIVSEGNEETTGFGRVGPRTGAKIEELENIEEAKIRKTLENLSQTISDLKKAIDDFVKRNVK